MWKVRHRLATVAGRSSAEVATSRKTVVAVVSSSVLSSALAAGSVTSRSMMNTFRRASTGVRIAWETTIRASATPIFWR